MDGPRDALRLPDGRLLVRHAGGVTVVPAGRAEAARRELDAAEGTDRPPAAPGGGRPPSPPGGGVRVTALVTGAGGAALAEALAASGRRVEAVAAERPANGARALRGADLALVLLERRPYGELYRLQEAALEAGVPALFVTADPDALRLGPLAVPGAGPCFACAVAADLAFLGLPPGEVVRRAAELVTGDLPAAAAALAPVLAHEIEAGLGGGRPTLAAGRLLVPRDPRRGGRLRVPLERVADCPLCAGRLAAPGDDRVAGLAAVVERELAARRLARPRLPGRSPAPTLPATDPPVPPGRRPRIGVVGGGSAGYLAALAFRRRFPEAVVTLVESPAIPVIGVGEATTPLMPQFLHVDLGLDAADFFRRVRPTWKLGIRFVWGGRPFAYPFGPVRALEAAAHDGSLDAASVRAVEIAEGLVPAARGADGAWRAAFDTDMAYHLDNRRFVSYLREEAAARGVERVEATVAEVELGPGRTEAGGEPEIAALIADDGRRFAFDLYVDCTGFRSLLVGDALGSPFVDFSASLLADRAVVVALPHGDGDGVRPATTAETFDAGWCWSTPVPEADHRGYVYASAFLSDEAARAELAAACGLGGDGDPADTRIVRYRTGRRRHFWRGNAIALGNAYGFVEPLESTALHMLVRQLGLALGALDLGIGGPGGADEPRLRLPGPALRRRLNEEVGAFWDYLRAFLALHYRFNRRRDTPFWRACREEVDLTATGDELLALYRERGPLSYDRAVRAAGRFPDPLWGPEGIDVVLLGQGVVPDRPLRPATGRAGWRAERELYRRVARRGTPQAELLAALEEDPAAVQSIAAAWTAAFRAAGPAFGG